MTVLRNLVFLVVLIFVFILNILLFFNKVFSHFFYFISLTIIVAVFILIDLLYSFHINHRLASLQREKEKLQLSIIDMQSETLLLKTLTDILETLGKDVSLEDVLERIAESVKSIFVKETVVLQLMGEKFKKCVIGKEIELPDELLGSIVLKPRPILVNNTSSFPEYSNLAKQGVSSFIISPFHHKRSSTGIMGIFSFENRSFVMKDLELLRMVSAPTSLLVENVELFEKVKILAITDSLTNIYNKRHFESIFEQVFNETKERNKPLSVCMADIDYFKHYNDLNGHPAGDYALTKIAEIMKMSIKGSDIIARYGGEEFILVFPETTKQQASSLCETIRRKIQEFKFANEESQPNKDLTISMGISSYPEDGETITQLIKKADEALYKAKQMGRNRVVTS